MLKNTNVLSSISYFTKIICETWPNQPLTFFEIWGAILAHLEIDGGSLDNSFGKPLALSFRITHWMTILKKKVP